MRRLVRFTILLAACGGNAVHKEVASTPAPVASPVRPAASSSAPATVTPPVCDDFVRWLAFNVANVKAADAHDISERTRLLKAVAVSGMGGNDEVSTASRQLADAAKQGDPQSLREATIRAEDVAARAHCPSEPSASGTVNGRIPPQVIQRLVRAHFGQIKRCYETALRADTSVQGRVATKFVIGRDGSVASAEEASSDGTLSADTRACIVNEFRKLEFPIPEGGIVTVVYPLIFSPGNQ